MEKQFTQGKLFHKKCWEMVAEILKTNSYNITGVQCASKFRSLKKTYKSIKNHNLKSGNDRRTWQYFKVMDEMYCKNAWCQPVALASFTEKLIKNTHIEESTTSSDLSNDDLFDKNNNVSKKRKKLCITELLAKNIAQKEEQENKRQKRHEERIALEIKLIDTFNQFLNK
ncbi:uncharacterized protein [Cardiocondyla obscurior]|uniref:uncharacterized protein n=1 Tax=Cardiocondyla obscurior TaxID=286306 RepID=UPI0039657926